MARYRIEFPSVSELVERAADESLPRWSHSSRRERRGFTGTASIEEALELARNGWPEGREMMVRSLDLAANQRPKPAPARFHDVGGMYPDVPRYCAGAPDCMVNLGDTSGAARPIVRILLNCVTSAGNSKEQIINRGVALLSAIDELEESGRSVELSICYTIAKFHAECVAKRAGEPLELDRLAFALAHPSFMRRFMFALIEQEPWAKRAVGEGYGPITEPDDLESGVALVPSIYSGSRSEWSWNSLTTALPAMRDLLAGAGVEFFNRLKDRESD